MIKDFRRTLKLKKNKNGHFSFFYILQLPHTVISNSEKIDPPYCTVYFTGIGSGSELANLLAESGCRSKLFLFKSATRRCVVKC